MRNSEPESMRWLRHAQADLKYARILQREGGHYLVCYLTQQVAEKALKALLYHEGEETVLGHSVRKLAERVAAHRPVLSFLIEKCSVLDSYYIPTRYPNGLPDAIAPDVYDSDTAERALTLAETALAAAEGAIT
jgi:HEPN domain-containing protein